MINCKKLKINIPILTNPQIQNTLKIHKSAFRKTLKISWEGEERQYKQIKPQKKAELELNPIHFHNFEK